MLSYQFREYGKPLEGVERATPAPQGEEVLVRVTGCGVCHSDVHLWEGAFDMGGGKKLDLSRQRGLPFTLGHEVVGEVVAAGPDAKGVAIGDRRIVYPWIGCGECAVCKAGEEHACGKPRQVGVNVDGGYATHQMVPSAKYLYDFGDIPDAVACLRWRRVSCSLSAMRKPSLTRSVANRSGSSGLPVGPGGCRRGKRSA